MDVFIPHALFAAFVAVIVFTMLVVATLLAMRANRLDDKNPRHTLWHVHYQLVDLTKFVGFTGAWMLSIMLLVTLTELMVR